jgi:putative ABC transport system ATP-binding protein
MIEITNALKTYGAGENATAALKGVSLTIEDGGFVVLLGASGSGKSTLLHIASGLEHPDSGTVTYDGVDIAAMNDRELTAFRREKTGFVFQQYFLLPGLNVDKNIKMGADLAGNKDYRKTIEDVGLGDKLYKFPSELSGGEQQRVSIARALAKKPKVLFLDEPTGALDEETGRQVLDYICKMQKELGFSMVMVTHNANIAEMADTVVKMNSGKIVETTANTQKKSAYEIGWGLYDYPSERCNKTARRSYYVCLRRLGLHNVSELQY